MMKRIGRFLLADLVIASLLLVSSSVPARPQTAEAASYAVGEIVLVARDLVDLKWYPAQYPQPQQKFLYWELYRGTSEANLASVATGASATTDFYRDTGLASGQAYTYRLDIVRCVDPCADASDERRYTFFTDSVTTGVFQGTVHRDLTLDSGVYQTTAVTVINSTLTVGSVTTVQDGSLRAVQGYLKVDSATLRDVSLSFGNNEEDSWGGGWVNDATIENGTISVCGVSDVRIQANSGDFSINISHTAKATIQDNTLADGISGISVRENASAIIRDNEITNGKIQVTGWGTSAVPKASALIVGNTITSAHKHFGVDVRDGASVEVTDNHIEWTEFHGSESSVLIMASGEGTSLIAERNMIISGKIGVIWGAAITLTENVIKDGGAAIAIGCSVCGTGIQATGSIERNTVQNGWGFEMWGGSEELTIKHNCIRGNDPGLTTDDAFMQSNLDMTRNWWNHTSGPYHPSLNPHGSGDAIEGNQVIFDPWDSSDSYCANIPPPPPPPDSVTLNLEASPTEIPPDGESQAMIFIELLDREGAGVGREQVNLSILPDHYGDQLGTLLSEVCVTDSHGQCLMNYQAPTAAEVYQHGHGAEKVTIEATADSGLVEEVDIWFTYLKVTDFLPAHGTRNQDWRSATTYAIFNQQINPSSVTADTFQVTSSWHYRNGLPCEYNVDAYKHVFCLLDLSDPLVHPNASKGLVITSEFKGGPDGILGTDNTFLRRDTSWMVYTTPALSPRIIAVQVSEDADMVAGRPAVVRVHAGLDEDTELDWVEAHVSLVDPVGGAVTREGYRFYPGELGGPLISKLQGNSANFHSRRGELPFASAAGAYRLTATVEPCNQHNPPSGEPLNFTAEADITVRDLKFNYYGARWVAAFPIAPKITFWDETYPWKIGETITSLANQPMGQNSRLPHTRLFPLKDPILYIPTHKVLSIYAHDVPMTSHGQYLAGIVRRNGYLIPVGVDATVMIVPREWMDEMNNGDPIFHGAAYHTCIIADDAPQVAIAHCLGHIYGLQDNLTGEGTVRGYDLARDRYLNSAYPELDPPLPLMRDDIGNLPAELAGNVWIGVQNYQSLMPVFVATAPRAAIGDAGVLESTTLAVGGAVIQEEGQDEVGLIDIVDLPARNATFPGPDGSGDYSLRLHDGSGTVLTTHPFSPVFSTLEEGVAYASFLFSFSAPNETRQVALLHHSTVLTSIIASASPPTVSVAQPSAGSYSGAISVTWSATDPDGDDADLNVSLSYSQDDGAVWYPVALSADGSSYTLDTTQFANCQTCRIKVVVDDGFHSTQAESAAFSVTNPPQVRAIWPAAGEDQAAPYTDIAAVFRDPMNENTIDSSSLALTDSQGNPVAGAVAYDEETRTVILTPAAGLAHSRYYTVRLAGTIEDSLGQSLGSDTVWTFRVEPGPLRIFLPLLLR